MHQEIEDARLTDGEDCPEDEEMAGDLEGYKAPKPKKKGEAWAENIGEVRCDVRKNSLLSLPSVRLAART